jgi:protease IV
MRSFLKFFFASLLAMVIFCVLAFFFFLALIGVVSSRLSPAKPALGTQAVLYLDLSNTFPEQSRKDELSGFLGREDANKPGLYEVVRLIKYAKTDSTVKGIFIRTEENVNGFATSQELRNALLDFKSSGKFIYAYGDMITQKAYYVANVADKVYCNPAGDMEWTGLSAQIMFLKHALDKLGVEPQIFYDGKFKSATEPLRLDKMSDENKLQTGEWLGDLNGQMLMAASAQRHIDTATLSRYAQQNNIRTAADAVKYGMIDGGMYRDEVLTQIRKKIGLDKDAEVNFVTLSKYNDLVNLASVESNKIAVIYAEGDIVYGRGQDGQIGSDEYIKWIRKARTDSRIKAIVLRVNSPGGSSLASDIIHREIMLCKAEGKPVIVSMGDYAASGGYYISCGADSIFAEPNTITGSIGVFAIIPNLQGLFKDKLGVTFDGVKTAPFADAGTMSRPLSETERHFFQEGVDSTYLTFKQKVASGRHLSLDQVEAIAQGRVWTGSRAMSIGLVDGLGDVQKAIDCAAKLAKLKAYGLSEFPESKSVLDRYFQNYTSTVKAKAIADELGPDGYRVYQQMAGVKAMMGKTEVRLPYDIDIR